MIETVCLILGCKRLQLFIVYKYLILFSFCVFIKEGVCVVYVSNVPLTWNLTYEGFFTRV